MSALSEWSLRVTERSLRVLLHAYPRGFRTRYGPAMLDLYRERFKEELQKRGLIQGGFALWVRTAVNFTGTGLAERTRGSATSGHERFRGETADGSWSVARTVGNGGAEFRRAIRSTRRSWRLSLAAIVCIGIGTAASSAVLTLYSSAVLRPLPFPDADRLVRVWIDDPEVGPRQQLAYPDVLDLQEQLTTLDRLEATARSRLMFLGDRGARRVEGEAVTAGYFDLLQVEPWIGRLFLAEEYEPGSEPVIVLSFGTWNAWFGADPDILGSTIPTSTRDYTVVGVLPPGFMGTLEDDIPDLEFWIPNEHDRTPEFRRSREYGYIWTVGRLGPGATLTQAQSEVRAIGARIAEANPVTRGPTGFRVERMGENWRQDFRRSNYLLLGAAALLLLVAAGNVAGLLVVRALGQRRELTIRAAIGADRAQLIRQVMVEASLLAAAGGVLGFVAGQPLLNTFLGIAPEEVPGYVAVTPTFTTFVLVLSVLFLTAVLAGTIPAVVTSRADPAGPLRGGGRGVVTDRRERRLGDWLVMGEIALTIVLVVTAGLLLRSYQSLGHSDLGFRTERLLRMAIFVDERDVGRTDQLAAFRERMRETLRGHPGVEAVGLVSPTVPPGTGGDARIRFDRMPEPAQEHGLPVHVHAVDPYFLDAMEIEITEGRGVRSGDDEMSPRVAVISESLAGLMGGAEVAIGQTIADGEDEYRIVGVARDVLFFGPIRRRARDFDVYVSMAQADTRLISIAITTNRDPAEFVQPLRERLVNLAPSSALDWVGPMTTEIRDHFEGRRFQLVLLGAFASSALALTALGLFAVLASLVARQASEFGVRVALGADRRRIIANVLRRGFVLAGGGLAFGAAGAMLVGRLLHGSLHGVGSFDPVTYAMTALLIASVTAAASCLPALHAARADPIDTIRAQ